MTPTPYRGPLKLEVREEPRTVTVYSWECPICRLVLRHVHRRTLQSNLERHLLDRHGEKAERRRQLEEIERGLGRVRKQLNRVSGGWS